MVRPFSPGVCLVGSHLLPSDFFLVSSDQQELKPGGAIRMRGNSHSREALTVEKQLPQTMESYNGAAKDKRPKDGQNNHGINKYFTGKDGRKDKGENLEKLEQGMNDGTISRVKLDAGLQQSVIKDHTGQIPSNTDQSSRSNHNPPEEIGPYEPPRLVVSKPDVTEDVEMQDLKPQPSDKSHPHLNEDGVAPEAEQPRKEQPTHQDPTIESKILQDEESTSSKLEDGCLAVLTIREKKTSGSKTRETEGDDKDVVIDAWGTLNGSPFVIIQDGPFTYASYRFERRKGYSHPNKVYISNEADRISRLKDKVASGKVVYRYTRDNFVGIYGIVCSNGKRKSTWMKIKWKDIRPDDAKILARGCSWEPKCELIRFCGGKKATEEKKDEVWRNQKQRYAEYKDKIAPNVDPRARGLYERSPTPCPPGMTIDQYRNDREERIGRDPAGIKPETSNGTRQQVDNPKSAESAIKTKDVFMQQHMSGDDWNNLSNLEKEKRKVELEALYDVYLEAVRVRQSGESPMHALDQTSSSVN